MAPSAALSRIVIENAAIATVDANDTEYASGYVVVADNKIESIGAGQAGEAWRTSCAASTAPATSSRPV